MSLPNRDQGFNPSDRLQQLTDDIDKKWLVVTTWTAQQLANYPDQDGIAIESEKRWHRPDFSEPSC